jgi:hypothetical protein
MDELTKLFEQAQTAAEEYGDRRYEAGLEDGAARAYLLVQELREAAAGEGADEEFIRALGVALAELAEAGCDYALERARADS